MSQPLIRPAAAGERRTALRLSLAAPHQSSGELENQVNGFIEHCRALSLSFDRQFVAEVNGRPVAACTCIAWPGRTGMVMLGPGRTPALISTLVELVALAVRSSSDDDIRLFQSLPLTDDSAIEAALLGAGFSNLAVLHYLERTVDSIESLRPAPPRGFHACDLTFETYEECRLEAWQALIHDSYDGSLDCPGLSGLRDMTDILDGHRGGGLFSPDHWLMLHHRGQPAGVMMLNAHPLRPVLEVAYTGVHPRLRGRGIGRYLVLKAFELAADNGYSAVTLAVDERNHPARAIYESAGFIFTGSRRAMIRPATAPTL